jgi:MEDS: MEthanogen/methylotroph, DcmR Sensory domain
VLDFATSRGCGYPPPAARQVAIDLALSPLIGDGACPHLAVLLRTDSELFPVLASFYALGAKRRGFLVHRSIRGDRSRDREQLAAAGLDVNGLEASEQFEIVEFDPDEPPEHSPQPWQHVLERSLSSGYRALWYSRFAVGPGDEEYSNLLPFERAWGQCFAGQPVVTLCPYIVGALDGAQVLNRVGEVSHTHEGVLLAGDNGLTLLRPTDA